jgi:hypothetical protein
MSTTAQQKKLTITVDSEVYEGLHNKIGRGNIGKFLNGLAKPYVLEDLIESGYIEMSTDDTYNKEALEWMEGLVVLPETENIWE